MAYVKYICPCGCGRIDYSRIYARNYGRTLGPDYTREPHPDDPHQIRFRGRNNQIFDVQSRPKPGRVPRSPSAARTRLQHKAALARAAR
jgi:hypothetical protein